MLLNDPVGGQEYIGIVLMAVLPLQCSLSESCAIFHTTTAHISKKYFWWQNLSFTVRFPFSIPFLLVAHSLLNFIVASPSMLHWYSSPQSKNKDTCPITVPHDLMSPINCCNCLSSFVLIRGVPSKESTVTSSPFVISQLHCFSFCANLSPHCLSDSLRNYHSIHVALQATISHMWILQYQEFISCRRSTKLSSITIQITSPCDVQMVLQPCKVESSLPPLQKARAMHNFVYGFQ